MLGCGAVTAASLAWPRGQPSYSEQTFDPHLAAVCWTARSTGRTDRVCFAALRDARAEPIVKASYEGMIDSPDSARLLSAFQPSELKALGESRFGYPIQFLSFRWGYDAAGRSLVIDGISLRKGAFADPPFALPLKLHASSMLLSLGCWVVSVHLLKGGLCLAWRYGRKWRGQCLQCGYPSCIGCTCPECGKSR